uniref:Uncharacterized protein n=1 Tax=Anguilla anguilla TaxID=7936 RepID=A0A0E9P8V4_ANGAN
MFPPPQKMCLKGEDVSPQSGPLIMSNKSPSNPSLCVI